MPSTARDAALHPPAKAITIPLDVHRINPHAPLAQHRSNARLFTWWSTKNLACGFPCRLDSWTFYAPTFMELAALPFGLSTQALTVLTLCALMPWTILAIDQYRRWMKAFTDPHTSVWAGYIDGHAQIVIAGTRKSATTVVLHSHVARTTGREIGHQLREHALNDICSGPATTIELETTSEKLVKRYRELSDVAWDEPRTKGRRHLLRGKIRPPSRQN